MIEIKKPSDLIRYLNTDISLDLCGRLVSRFLGVAVVVTSKEDLVNKVNQYIEINGNEINPDLTFLGQIKPEFKITDIYGIDNN
jgi:hypothetical protein